MKLKHRYQLHATADRIPFHPTALSSFVLKDNPCPLFTLHDSSSATLRHEADTEQSPRQSSDFIYASSDLRQLE